MLFCGTCIQPAKEGLKVILTEKERQCNGSISTGFLQIPPDSLRELRLIVLMDHKDVLLRGWREALTGDTAVTEDKEQGFCQAVGLAPGGFLGAGCFPRCGALKAPGSCKEDTLGFGAMPQQVCAISQRGDGGESSGNIESRVAETRESNRAHDAADEKAGDDEKAKPQTT